jgi:TonB-linked SusC/RagA family outer membrane protein
MEKNKIEQLSDGALSRVSACVFLLRSGLIKVSQKTGFWISLMAMFMTFQSALAQSGPVQITVVNRDGQPVSGARVELVGGSGVAEVTNSEGVVVLNADQAGLIKVSYANMENTFVIDASDVLIRMDNRDKKIKLGYGYEKSPDKLTASVDVVYSDDIKNNSVLDPAESLYGQLSGLTVLQNGGEPWNRSPDMFIRGRGTFNNSSMLVLVDGFERDMSSLSLPEIESVSVLKDGAALAIYGQRGANGVVLVTTKGGEYNSFNVDVSYEQGFNMPFRTPQFLDGYGYAQAVNEASALDGNPFVYSNYDLQDFQSGNAPYFYPNVDWWDETLRDYGTSTNFNSSFYGGGEAVKYFVTLNYQNERGLFDNTELDDRYNSQMKYDRFNFRTNLDIDLTKTTRFLIHVGGSVSGRKEPGARVSGVMDALYSVPSAAFPVETFNGVWGGTEYYANNPVALVSSTGMRQPHSREVMADGRIIQDLGAWVEGLTAEVAVAYDNNVAYWENKTRDFLYESVAASRNPETGAITDTTVARYGSETDLRFSDSFGGQRRHATLFGKVNYEKAWDQNELDMSFMYHQDKRVNDRQYNTFLHQKMVASASYALRSRYLLDGVVSYSGSSVLPAGERFGIFPAVSAGWIASREDFLKSNAVIDFLKFRASWGMTGNNIMSPNLYDQAFGGGGTYYFTNNNNSYSGIREGQLPTLGLTYETAVKTNLGVDLKLLDHLSMTMDVFYENRHDILVSSNGSVPSLIGVARPVANFGEVENKGLEASLLWEDQIGSLKYHIGGNFSYAKNSIVEMSEEFRPYDYLKETGNSVGQQFGLETLGFFKDQADIDNSPRQLFSELRPGDIKYKDQNDDGVIDELDVVPMGYANGYPEIYYASNIGFEFKGFGVDALFQGIANQTLYLNTKSVFWPLRGQNTISTFSADRWTPETAETATLPRLSMLENANNYRKNDIWLTSGDYLKLRKLEVYYNFSDRLLSKLNMKSAKLFVRGMNLFSIDMVDVVDSEEIGVTYPTLTSYHMGINLGF